MVKNLNLYKLWFQDAEVGGLQPEHGLRLPDRGRHSPRRRGTPRDLAHSRYKRRGIFSQIKMGNSFKKQDILFER